MADYFAVLQRTLSGFEAPQAGLREKLYERARLTIRRQLDSRVPAIDEATVSAEMAKLEQAIADTEVKYGGSAAAPVPIFTPPEPSPEPSPEPFVEVTPEPLVAEPEAAPVPAVEAEQVLEPQPVAPPTQIDVEEVDPIAAALADFTQADVDRKAERVVEEAVNIEPELEPVVLEPEVPVESADNAANNAVEEALAAMTLEPEPQPLPEPVPEPVHVAVEPEPAPPIPAELPPVDLAPAAEVQPPLMPVVEEPAPPIPMHPQAAPASMPELQPVDFGDHGQEELAIPPAAGLSGGERRNKKSRWLLWLLLVLLLLAGAAAAFVTMKDTVLSTLGLDNASVTAAPTKVKTIKVSPDPQPVEEPTSEAAPESTEEPKSEARLNESGDEVVDEAPVVAPQETSEQPAASPQTSNRAFLYEEDAGGGSTGVDNGTVSWSVVQEAPAPGQAEEPAIRAQIEIPDRKTVLIMTIKRNADTGLSASHIVELIFAVPDDFSGGAVNEINRLVMKESEEGRGETLTASSVKISEGIFLIALDNLVAAKTRNIELLRSRSWLDIPVQYRTGKRALVTIEKGSEGEAIFKEVFAAWDKAS